EAQRRLLKVAQVQLTRGAQLSQQGTLLGLLYILDACKIATLLPEAPLFKQAAWAAWQVEAGPLLKFRSVSGGIAISPDGKRLATASGGKFVQVLDVETGEAVAPPFLQDGPVFA